MKLYDLLLQMENRIQGRISLEPFNIAFWDCDDLRLPTQMNLHNHDFCRYIKQHDGNRSCALNKQRSMKIAALGRRFCGCCPYGMWELVQPVIHNKKLAAILYFGGFCEHDKLPPANKYGLFRGKLPPEIPLKKIDLCKKLAALAVEFIRFELDSCHLEASPAHSRQYKPQYYLDIIKDFLSKHFNEDVTLRDAAELCRISPCYLSTFLRRYTGKSFRQLLTDQRLAEAEVALKYRSDLSIADIAYQSGFADSNYFCTVFKKNLGCAPSRYRASWRQLQEENCSVFE